MYWICAKWLQSLWKLSNAKFIVNYLILFMILNYINKTCLPVFFFPYQADSRLKALNATFRVKNPDK